MRYPTVAAALLLMACSYTSPTEPVSASSSSRAATAASTAPKKRSRPIKRPPPAQRPASLTTSALAGEWGGEHIRLVLGATSATFELDCAHGTIGALTVDAQGTFTASGTLVSEHGGPVRPGDDQSGKAVSFTGQTDGKSMTFRIVSPDDPKGADMSYVLQKGSPARLFRCY